MRKIVVMLIIGCVTLAFAVVTNAQSRVDEQAIEERVQATLAKLTLKEKAGQMVQAERANIKADEVMLFNVGSILSGGGSLPPTGNKPQDWLDMYNRYQEAALKSSSGIPILYGVDAVHGHNNVASATVFPHNIGLGAANDPELMFAIGQATAKEVQATGLDWNFSPSVAVGQDIRWGRYYESFGESAELQRALTKRYVEGLQQFKISATAKHFIADGGTVWNPKNYQDASWALRNPDSYKSDQGDAKVSETELREIHLAGYLEALAAGVDTIMVSFSSINGKKLHAHELIETLLKTELGFKGIVISDYEAIHQLPGSFKEQVITSVNAGIDMLMEPGRWREAIGAIVDGVNEGKIAMERVDDAVTRILTVKHKLGLMDQPIKTADFTAFNSEEHRALAREAVRKSLVLLKNERNVLPLAKNSSILLLGPGRDNVGMQSGGWTITWQGTMGTQVKGTSIKQGLELVAKANGGQIYTDPKDAPKAGVAVVVIGEIPYAEGVGDNGRLTLDSATAHRDNLNAIAEAKSTGLPTVVILLSGRPLLITDYVQDWDGLIAAFLPGSEGGSGIADLLYGDFDFSGNLPVTWPKSAKQFGETINKPKYEPEDYLFPYGFGLRYK